MRDLSGLAIGRAENPMLQEVRDGLARSQKELPPKFFYDRRGSLLFEAITRLPEYYLTRTERALLDAWMPALIAELRPRALVELGAGGAEKTRIVLQAMRRAGVAGVYVPIDVSAAFLHETAAGLRKEYPGLEVRPVVADLTGELHLPRSLPRPVLHAFLGSTIGNFDPPAAIRLLRRVRSAMCPDDRFLMGADLRKDVRLIKAAYNDADGITAEFNRNALRVLNSELGANFDAAAFEHRAFYDREAHRIEMHLVAAREHEVTIPGVGSVHFARGETIRTEISCKYDRETIAGLFAAAGLGIEAWTTDRDALYALILGCRRE